MIVALSTPRNRTVSIVFLAICIVLTIAAILVGIDDNPPGIIMAFAAAAALILAFVHPWRTTRQYARFLIAVILAFVVFAILHNVFHGLAKMAEHQKVLQTVVQILGVTTFLIAVLICPPAIVVGAVGTVTTFIIGRRQS